MKSLFELALKKLCHQQIKNSLSGLNIELSPEELTLLRLEKEEEKFEKFVGKENLDFFYQNFTYQQLCQLYDL